MFAMVRYPKHTRSTAAGSLALVIVYCVVRGFCFPR
jgi:hypothetical protein